MSDSMRASFKAMSEAIGNMQRQGKDYNAQDSAFIREMVKHHEMAVEMSDEQVSKGMEPEAIALAKTVRKAQAGEIAQMKRWLKDRGVSGGMKELQ